MFKYLIINISSKCEHFLSFAEEQGWRVVSLKYVEFVSLGPLFGKTLQGDVKQLFLK